MTPLRPPSHARGRIQILLTVCSFLLLALSRVSGAERPAQLSLNENAWGPSPLVAKALLEEFPRLQRYADDELAGRVQKQIALKEGVAPEQILLGEILEGLGLELGRHPTPGGEFIYSVPGYPALVNAAASVGGTVVSVPLNTSLENDLPALEARINEHTRALFLVNPHNPSGTVSANAEFHAFLSRVSKRALVILDEAYLEYSDDFESRTAVAHTRAAENVIVFRTFAKIHGLAGLSFGYAVAPRALALQLAKQGLGNAHSLNRLSLAAASASLADTAFIPRIQKAVTHERALWNGFLDAQSLRHTESQANFVFFDAGFAHAEVAAALATEGVLIGRAFPPYAHWLRITLGLPEENERARKALSAFLNTKGHPAAK